MGYETQKWDLKLWFIGYWRVMGYFLVTELVDAQNYGLLEVMGFLRDGL